MSWLRRLIDWVRGGRDAALNEELEAHRTFAEEELQRAGLTPSEAAAESRRRMGNVTLAREDSRDVWIVRWADRLTQHLRFGARGLRREPVFALTAILTLALGTAAATSVFSVADAELWRLLPYPGAKQLVTVQSRGPAPRNDTDGMLISELVEWRAAVPALTDLAAAAYTRRRAVRTDHTESLRGADISANYFTTLSRRAIAGRVFGPADARGSDAIILGERGWRRLFDAAPDVVGQSVLVDGRSRTIVGVIGIDDSMSLDAELFLPIDERPGAAADDAGGTLYGAIGRLKDGNTAELATEQLQAVLVQRAAIDKARQGHSAFVSDLSAYYTTQHAGQLYFFLGASLLVLVLTITNVSGLFLSRAFRRAPEFALRGALGGGARTIALQLLVEAVLISIPAFALSIAMTLQIVGLTGRFVPEDFLLRGTHIIVDSRAVGFCLTVVLTATLALALIPLQIARRAKRSAVMASSQRTGPSRGATRARHALLTAQIATTVVLLIGGALFLRSFIALTRVPLGFDPADGWSMRVSLSGPRFADPQAIARYTETLSTAARAIPGVKSAALATTSPLRSGWLSFARDASSAPPAPGSAFGDRTIYRAVGPDYFQTIGTPILKGRPLAATDVAGAPVVGVVNEEFVRKVLKGADPIGRVVTLGGSRAAAARSGDVTIVGVAANIREVGMNEVAFADIYLALAQAPATDLELLVRGRGKDAGMPAAMRAAAAGADPGVPVTAVAALDQRVTAALQSDRFNLGLAGGFAVIALLIAGIGIYGAMAYAAMARAREVGVRIALGATPRRVVTSALWQSARLGLTGTVLGLCGAYLFAKWLGDTMYLVPGVHNGLLYNVTTTDPIALATASIGMLVMALLAGTIPARRLARIDPVKTLRAE